MEGQLALTMFLVVCGILLLGFPVALALGGTARELAGGVGEHTGRRGGRRRGHTPPSLTP